MSSCDSAGSVRTHYLIRMSAARKKPETATVPDYLRELVEGLPLMLTLQEAAGVLRVHPRTMQRIVADQEVVAMRGKLTGPSRVIIPRSEIVRWLLEHSAR